MTFFDRLRERVRSTGGILGVELNPELARLPDDCREYDYPRRAFTRRIVDATHEDAAAYVVSPAYYEDSDGWTALAETVAYAHGRGVPVILDGKYSDVVEAGRGDLLGVADAVTVSPFPGGAALAPALDRDLGVFVVCRTPNSGAADLQRRELAADELLSEHVADVASYWAVDREADVGLLVGGPTEAVETVRERAPDLPFLVVGGANADPEVAAHATVTGPDDAGRDGEPVGLVGVSREVVHAGDAPGRGGGRGADAYAAAARQSARRLKRQLNRHR